MTALANSFEGQASGTAVSAANSGGSSGDAFDAVTIVSGGSAAFSNAQSMHGAQALSVSTGLTTTTGSFVTWSTSLGSVTTHFGRAYIRLTAAPATSDAIIEGMDSTTFAWAIQLTTSKTLAIQSSTFSTVHTMSTVLALNTWYRVEWEIVNSATVGQVVLSLYLGDTGVAVESFTGSSNQNYLAATTSVNFGYINGHASQPQLFFDDIALSTVAAIGTVQVPVVSNNFEGLGTGVLPTVANSGGASGTPFDTVSKGANATVVGTTTAAHGSEGLSINNTAGNSGSVGWTSGGPFGAPAAVYFRLYCQISAFQTNQLRLFNVTANGSSVFTVGLNTVGKIVLTYGSAGTSFITFTSIVPTGSWFRVEGFVIPSASVGQISATLFSTPDSLTATETHTSTATLNTGTLALPTTYSFGNSSAVQQSSAMLYDDVALSSVGPLGPAVTSASGSIQLKKQVLSGVSHEKSVATGAIRLKKQVLSGASAEKSVITAAIRLKKQVLSGAITDSEAVVATGAIKLKKQVLSGASHEKSVATGAIKLKKQILSGASAEKSVVTGAIKLKKQVLSGASSEKTVVTGSIRLKKQVLSGASAEKSVVTGAVKLKKQVLHGASVKTTTATGAIRLKKQVLSGASHEKSVTTGNIRLKKQVLSGASHEKSVASGTISLKKQVLSGAVTEKTELSGALVLKKQTVEGVLHSGATLPKDSSLFIFSLF
jgi:uncharacterized protein YjbI with pentapeptide repeats